MVFIHLILYWAAHAAQIVGWSVAAVCLKAGLALYRAFLRPAKKLSNYGQWAGQTTATHHNHRHNH
jgi:hypothetical protein